MDANTCKYENPISCFPASLQSMTEGEWSNLRLPLRLLEEVQNIISESSAGIGNNYSQDYSPKDSIFVDPSRHGPTKPDPRIVTDKQTRESRLLTVSYAPVFECEFSNLVDSI